MKISKRMQLLALGIVQAWFAIGFILGLAIVPMIILVLVYWLITKLQVFN